MDRSGYLIYLDVAIDAAGHFPATKADCRNTQVGAAQVAIVHLSPPAVPASRPAEVRARRATQGAPLERTAPATVPHRPNPSRVLNVTSTRHPCSLWHNIACQEGASAAQATVSSS